MQVYDVELTFTEPLLGGVPKNPKLYEDYIVSKAPVPDDPDVQNEVLTVQESLEKGSTGFHTDEHGPLLYDYLIKGFFKDACGMLSRSEGTLSSKQKAYKKVIDGLVFILPRRLYLNLPPGEQLTVLERPLRAQTAQGERVALARSDAAPAGTTLRFEVHVLGGVSEPLLREWLDYGALRGAGQWRNASYGRFTYTLSKREV